MCAAGILLPFPIVKSILQISHAHFRLESHVPLLQLISSCVTILRGAETSKANAPLPLPLGNVYGLLTHFHSERQTSSPNTPTTNAGFPQLLLRPLNSRSSTLHKLSRPRPPHAPPAPVHKWFHLRLECPYIS